jgi:hypothetical protein
MATAQREDRSSLGPGASARSERSEPRSREQRPAQSQASDITESRRAHLVAVTALGFLLFGYPLLAVFDVPRTILGVPVLWAYLFLAWAAVVALVALAVRRLD